MSSATRQQAFKARMIESGLVQINLWVPAQAVPDFQAAAEKARENAELTVARMVHRRTGKLSGLR